MIVLFSFWSDHQKKDDEKVLDPLEKLAASYGLRFLPDSSGEAAEIVGEYRDHRLKFSTSPTNTDIEVSTNNPTNADFSFKKQFQTLTAKEVIRLLIPHGFSHRLAGKIKANYHKISYKYFGFENNIDYLRFLFNLLVNLAIGYHKVVGLGGEAVPALQRIITDKNDVLQRIAPEILKDIAHETKNRLGHHPASFLCPQCWAYPDTYKVRISWWRTITYYGCRLCGQSRVFLEKRGIVVLDGDMTTEQAEQDESLWINWLLYRNLFDFSEVQILRATDKDVEEFAIQVGNDTDKKRKKRYQSMSCIISADCKLSQNTMRVLRHIFGQVKIKEQLKSPVLG